MAIFHLIDNDNDGSVSYAEYTNLRKLDAAVDENSNSAHFMNVIRTETHQKVWVSRSIQAFSFW